LKRSPAIKSSRAILPYGGPIHRLFQGGTITYGADNQGIRLPLTHEEIGQTIGATRETVSRLFCELRRKRLVRSEGCELAITNRPELEEIVQF